MENTVFKSSTQQYKQGCTNESTLKPRQKWKRDQCFVMAYISVSDA